MAAAIGGVLTTLLLFLILMQFQSVLIPQELDEDFIYSNGFRWPVLTPKILCFGKEILSRRFGNFNHNNRSSRHNGAVKTNQLLCVLCLILANDILLNPGPNGDFTCIGCEKDQLLETESVSFEKFEWICDSCIDLACEKSSTDQSVNEILASLPKGVKFAHVNLCGILNKLDQIRILLKDGIFDVFAVTESKLDCQILDSEIQIKGYTIVRRDRNRYGGGVLMYIKDKWTITNVCKDENLELLTADIKLLKSPKINVGVVYRPPDSNAQWITDFEERIDDMSTAGTEQVTMGDLNIDEMKSSSFKTMMEVCGFPQLISEPTRVTSSSSTLIDHIYVNQPISYSSRGVIPIG